MHRCKMGRGSDSCEPLPPWFMGIDFATILFCQYCQYSVFSEIYTKGFDMEYRNLQEKIVYNRWNEDLPFMESILRLHRSDSRPVL